MTLHGQENGNSGNPTAERLPCSKLERGCFVDSRVCLLLAMVLMMVVVILAIMLFKIKKPRTQLQHASIEGVAPRVTLPVLKIELNVTLNLTLFENQNHASFKGGQGESMLLYKGGQVGYAQVDPRLIPAMGNTTLVTFSGLKSLMSDIMDGEVALETKTRIPGRAIFLGIFRRIVVTTCDCHIVIGFPDFKIKSQDCKQHTILQ